MKPFPALRALSLSVALAISGSIHAQENPDVSATPTQATNLPAGTARGTLIFDGTTVELKFAGAFVDQKDERKPVALVLSDVKLPTEKWTSDFDTIRDETKWSGVVIFFDQKGAVDRCDVHLLRQQSSVSGYWEVKLERPGSKELTGTARTFKPESEKKLDAIFHATLK